MTDEIVWPEPLLTEMARQGMSGRELARRTGFDQSRVSRITRSEQQATVEDLGVFANALRVSPAYLLLGHKVISREQARDDTTRIERLVDQDRRFAIQLHTTAMRANQRVFDSLNEIVREVSIRHEPSGHGVLGMHEFMMLLTYADSILFCFPRLDIPADPDSGFAVSLAQNLSAGRQVRFLISNDGHNPSAVLAGWRDVLTSLTNENDLPHWQVRLASQSILAEANLIQLNEPALSEEQPVLHERLMPYIHNGETVDIFDPSYENFTHHFADRHRFNAAKTVITHLWNTAQPA